MTDRLALLLRTGQLIGSSLEIQQVLDTLMDQVIEAIGAENGFVLLREGDVWEVRSARSSEDLGEEDLHISRTIADGVATSGKSVITSDALHDERFRQRPSVGLYNLRSILCVPLLSGGRILGVLYADHRMAAGAFMPEDLQLLEAIAGQAAVAVENALLVEKLKRVHQSSLEQARQELAQTQAQLLQSSKLAAVGQLAAGVAHEINNPLGALAMNLSGMQAQTQDEALKRRMNMCLGAVDRCKQIVSRLLNFAHNQRPPGGPVELVEVLTKTCELAEADLRQRDILLVREMAGPLVVEGDATSLSQVFLNLLLNSRDSLMERPQGRTIWVRARRQGDSILAEVTDNGMGMTAEVAQRIFEPFFTTKPVGQGVGLGLSVCYQIVQSQGGEIKVDSRPGEGTRFLVTFRA